jgi:hypothetical protein
MSFTRDSSWICQFPISLAVEGPACYERMARAGIGRLLFNTVIYAPYRMILPRYPRKGLYSMEEGLYHYRPEPRRYADLPVAPPAARDWGERDMLAEAVNGARRAGMSPGAWLTVFANGKIAKDHPEWAVRNLYDSADRLFLDFNHPEVREYTIRVCLELAERYDLDEIMLDKIPQANLEMDALGGMRIDPVLRILGSFCFSTHARAAAAASGIDLEECRQKALSLAAECLRIPPHVINAQRGELRGDTEAPLLLLDHPWIMDVLRWRHACILSFLAELRKRLDAVRRGVSLSVCFVPPVQAGHDAMQPRPWLAVQSYAAYKNAPVDRIHSVIHWDEDPVEYDTCRAVAALAGGTVKLTTHIRAYGPTRPEQLIRLASAVQRAGAQGIAYFCYDIMTEEMLDAAGGISGM